MTDINTFSSLFIKMIYLKGKERSLGTQSQEKTSLRVEERKKDPKTSEPSGSQLPTWIYNEWMFAQQSDLIRHPEVWNRREAAAAFQCGMEMCYCSDSTQPPLPNVFIPHRHCFVIQIRTIKLGDTVCPPSVITPRICIEVGLCVFLWLSRLWLLFVWWRWCCHGSSSLQALLSPGSPANAN